MNYPSKLKRAHLFLNGTSFSGEAKNINIGEPKRISEDWRAAGMGAALTSDQGYEMPKVEWTFGGLVVEGLKAWGGRLDGTQVRIVEGFQNDQTGAVSVLEVVVRGRINEIALGEAEGGKDAEHKYVCAPAYYKLTIDGAVIYELDPLNDVEIVAGVDQTAALRNAMGGAG